MRFLIIFLAALCISACGDDGAPPAGQVDGSPSTGGFVPEDY